MEAVQVVSSEKASPLIDHCRKFAFVKETVEEKRKRGVLEPRIRGLFRDDRGRFRFDPPDDVINAFE